MENTDYEVMDETVELMEEPTVEYTVYSEGASRRTRGLATVGGMALAGGIGYAVYKGINWLRFKKAERAELKRIKEEHEDAQLEEEEFEDEID